MPRVGKSTLGLSLAEKLALPFYDSDIILAERLSLERAEAFESLGENRFRGMEYSCIKDLLAKEDDFVLSTGGGCVKSEKLQRLLIDEPIVIYITAPFELIAERIAKEMDSGKELPKFLNLKKESLALQGKSKNIAYIAEALKNIFFEREKIYQMLSKYTVENSGNIESCVEKIIHLIR